MAFNYPNTTDLPKLTDVINGSTLPPDILRIFLEPWILFLGGWFFAWIFGILAGALYIKQQNVYVPLAFFIVMMLLCGSLLTATPYSTTLTSAEAFSYIFGVIGAFAIGFILYQLIVSKRA